MRIAELIYLLSYLNLCMIYGLNLSLEIRTYMFPLIYPYLPLRIIPSSRSEYESRTETPGMGRD